MAFKKQSAATIPVVPIARDIQDPPAGSVNPQWWQSIRQLLKDHQDQLAAHQATIQSLQASISALTKPTP